MKRESHIRVSPEAIKGLKLLKEKEGIPLNKLADKAIKNYLKLKKPKVGHAKEYKN